MPQTTEAYDLQGRTMFDQGGEKIGKIDDLYYDRAGGQPEWALVSTGMFGTKKTFVPIAGATTDGDDVHVPVTKDQVKDAPRIEADHEMSEAEERQLFQHYGVPYTTEGTTTAEGTPGTTGYATGTTGYDTGTAGRDRSGRTTDDAMTRSEEELHVGTAEHERGRARLRKYVVTENVTRTVPVQREEVRVEREPITDANIEQAMSGPDISEDEHEVVLHEEEPVVEKRAVPKERVRLGKETVGEEREVTEEVRKERIDTDGLDERA